MGAVMNDYSLFALQEEQIVHDDARAHEVNRRLLLRSALPKHLNDSRGGSVKPELIVDVETTRLSLATDEVIQLAMLSFSFDLGTLGPPQKSDSA